MKAYSIELRQKILDAHNQQERSQRQMDKLPAHKVAGIREAIEAVVSDSCILVPLLARFFQLKTVNLKLRSFYLHSSARTYAQLVNLSYSKQL